MALTPQQIETLARQAKLWGYDEAKAQRYIEFTAKKAEENSNAYRAAQPQAQPQEEGGVLSKVKNVAKGFGNALISSEKGVGESLAAGVIPLLPSFKQAQESDAKDFSDFQNLVNTIREKKARGETVSPEVENYIKTELERRSKGEGKSFDYETINPASTKSNRQALAEVAGVGLDVLTAGTYGAAAKGMKTGSLVTKSLPTIVKPIAKVGSQTVVQAAKRGAIEGAKKAAPVGAAYGAIEGLKDDENGIGGVAWDTIKGGAFGALFGGALGAITSGTKTLLANRKELKETAQTLLEQRAAQKPGPAAASKNSAFAVDKQINEKLSKEAVRRGFDEKYINVIKESSPVDKTVYQKMFKKSVDASKNLKGSLSYRPQEEVGQTFLERVRALQKARQEVGSKLGATIKKLPNQSVPTDQIYDNFINELGEANVKISSKGKLNFAESALANDGNAQRLLQQTFDDLRPGKAGVSSLKPTKLDVIRKRLFNDLDLAKKGNATSSNAERILTGVRADIGDILSGIDPQYSELSKQYRDISDVLSRFNSIMGREFKIGSATANLKAGEVMRRVMSNASAKPMQLVLDVDNLAKLYGADMAGDIQNQLIFADMMQDLFGIIPKNSLAGQVQKANEATIKAGIGVAEDVANRNFGNLLYKGVLAVNNKVRGITPEKQQEIIAQLIGMKNWSAAGAKIPPITGKAGSLADEAAKLTEKRGLPSRLFEQQQTKIEQLLNKEAYTEALEVANKLAPKTAKEEAMKKSLINMIQNYLK